MAMKRMFWVGAAVRVEVRRRRAVRRWLIGDCGLRNGGPRMARMERMGKGG